MKQSWPIIPLGQVIRHRKEFIVIDDLTEYRRCRVQLHAKGIVLRDIVMGGSIRTKQQQVCRTGELLVAEIDAKVGGFGIVPLDLDGAIVSSHYFLYQIDEHRLDRGFLDYYIRTRAFRDQVEAQGSTNYAAIRPQHVLDYTIPLPPLAEQQRIVARIDALAARIEEIRNLHSAVIDDLKRMLLGVYGELTNDAPSMPMAQVAPIVRRPVEVEPDIEYGELGIRSFGNGTFHKPPQTGLQLGSKRVFQIQPGDLLFSNVFAWEGAIAVVKPEDAGRIGSHRFISCVPKPDLATAESLRFHFLTPAGLLQIGEASPGGAGRNRTLGLGKLESLVVPVPPLEKQRWFDDLQAKVDAVKRLQAETQAELDALLPAVLDRAFRGEL